MKTSIVHLSFSKDGSLFAVGCLFGVFFCYKIKFCLEVGSFVRKIEFLYLKSPFVVRFLS